MNRNTTRLVAATLVAGACIASSAHATNGYFTHGTGTKNKGMVGAGIALPQDAIDTVNNPAVATEVGENMQIGAALFSPRRSYSTTAPPPGFPPGAPPRFTIGPNDVDSDSEYFVIPHFSRSWQQTDKRAFAVSFYGRGGMNTDWAVGSTTASFYVPQLGQTVTVPGTFGAGRAGVDLSQAFLDITWAWRVTDRASIGIAPLFAAQVFEAVGVSTFAPFTRTYADAYLNTGMPANPANLSNNGHEFSWGYGLKVGLHANLSDAVSLGIMYQSKIYMTEFDDYADLFAEQGDFDIPANFKIGWTWTPRENLHLSFDIEHTWFSDVAAVGNPIANIFACPTSPAMGPDVESCLGGDRGAGFGWDDMTTYKLGVQWNNGGDWTWRAGYSHGDQPVPETEMTFNILAPAVIEDHFSFGFTKVSGENRDREWNFAVMYAPSESQTGPNNFDPTQTVTWEMDQFELELSYGWRF